MPSYEEIQVRYASDMVTVVAYTCAYPHVTYSKELATPVPCFAIPRTGICVKRLGKQEIFADPNHVMFFNQDEPYRIRHEACNCKDCGTTMAVNSDLLAEIITNHTGLRPDGPETMFAATHGPITPEITIQRRMLVTLLDEPDTSPLDIEETVVGLTDAVIAASCSDQPYISRSASGPRSGAAATELVDAVKMFLARRFRETLSLDEIADAVCCSRFHLCRTFSKSVRLPLHKYIHRLRLNEAVERLAGGEEDLTRLAMDLGYCSHSHFTNVFRREFGETPSSIRDQLRSA